MGFKEFLVRRLITMTITVLIVLTFNFIIFRLPMFILGLDPADIVIPPEADPVLKVLLRKMWHLPPKNAGWCAWLNYYTTYMSNLITFNFGYSFQRPTWKVADLIMARLPITVIIFGSATIISIIIGIRLGVMVGAKAGSKLDVALVSISLFMYSLPAYWVGLLGILFLSSYLKIFPISGFRTVPPITDSLLATIDVIWHIALPVISFVVVSFGYALLLMRNNLLTVLTEDFILTARAKGFDENYVLYRHALKNAFIPMVVIVVFSIAFIWTGAIITEQVFSIPGMGQLFYYSIIQNDWTVAESLFYLIALSTVISMFIVDIVVAMIDPRIRVG